MSINEETDTTTQSLEVAIVQTGSGTQMRESMNGALIESYTEDINNGAEFPPVDIFYDGKTYWLADGFHRFFATRDSGAKMITANIHKGTLRDAVLFAVGANSAHGLRRTNADKRKAVATLLDDKEWSGWSDRVIAEKCGVHHDTVNRHRHELSDSDSSLPALTRGKDGKKRKRPKKRKKALPDADSFPDAEPDDAKPASKKPLAAVAAQEIEQTVKGFLRLKPAVEDVGPVMVALDEMQTLLEEFMQ
jgi:hypothetical protein